MVNCYPRMLDSLFLEDSRVREQVFYGIVAKKRNESYVFYHRCL